MKQLKEKNSVSDWSATSTDKYVSEIDRFNKMLEERQEQLKRGIMHKAWILTFLVLCIVIALYAFGF